MDELIHGSPAHLPMTAGEFHSWIAYDEIIAEETRRAQESGN